MRLWKYFFICTNKSTHTDQYLRDSSHHQTCWRECFVSCLLNRVYSINANKDDLINENVRTKEVLKENGYQKSIVSKIFKRITNNHSLSQQTHVTDVQENKIKMTINLPYVQGTSEKLGRILTSHRIRSTFYTENNLRKLLCKLKIIVKRQNQHRLWNWL